MIKIKCFAWEEELRKIINNYKKRQSYDVDEALNGDETEELAEILHLQIDLTEGNITIEEYWEKWERREKEVKARLKCKKCKKEFKIENDYMGVVTCPYCSEYIEG